jgi:hypothetical protein
MAPKQSRLRRAIRTNVHDVLYADLHLDHLVQTMQRTLPNESQAVAALRQGASGRLQHLIKSQFFVASDLQIAGWHGTIKTAPNRLLFNSARRNMWLTEGVRLIGQKKHLPASSTPGRRKLLFWCSFLQCLAGRSVRLSYVRFWPSATHKAENIRERTALL